MPHPSRWRVRIGAFEDDTPALLPAAQINLLIRGESGTGKSFVAGLVAERLLDLDYTLCILDPEGDHVALAQHRGMAILDASVPTFNRAQLDVALRVGFGGVLVDFSGIAIEDRPLRVRESIDAIAESRRVRARPHWVFLDEAHVAFGAETCVCEVLRPALKGLCLATYHPETLCPQVMDAIDITLTAARVDEQFTVELTDAQSTRAVALDARRTSHVRHWHKYATGQLSPWKRFYFRSADRLTGRSAGNLLEFRDELVSATDTALAHHGERGDFSRWLDEVIGAHALAAEVRDIEGRLPVAPIASVRSALLDVIEREFVAGGGSLSSSSARERGDGNVPR